MAREVKMREVCRALAVAVGGDVTDPPILTNRTARSEDPQADPASSLTGSRDSPELRTGQPSSSAAVRTIASNFSRSFGAFASRYCRTRWRSAPARTRCMTSCLS